MDAKKILFATDFSSASDGALKYATSLASESGATLFIVHVEEPPMSYGGGELYYGIPDPDTEELNNMLTNLKPHVDQVPYEHRMLLGNPATEIVQFVKDENIDLVVLGTHGRTGVNRLLMGSVAELVVRKSPCPVFVFKQPESKTATSS